MRHELKDTTESCKPPNRVGLPERVILAMGEGASKCNDWTAVMLDMMNGQGFLASNKRALTEHEATELALKRKNNVIDILKGPRGKT